MPPLRILHVTPYSAGAWAYGGIPRLADTLTRALARQGHAVTICTTDAGAAETRLMGSPHASRRRPWPAYEAQDGVTVRVFPNLSNRLAYHWQGFAPIGLSAYLRAHATDFDIGHLHACRNFPGVIAARHLRRAGVPYVLAPNGTAGRIERRYGAKRLFDRVFGEHVLRGAAALVAVTATEQRQLMALNLPDSRVAQVPNPVDLDEFTLAPERGRFRREAGLGASPVVAFLGKLTPRKRVDVLARAFARLPIPEARLVIAGNDMGSGSDVRALVRELGIADRTTFTGLVEGAARLRILADADVVVYPSQHEIFGLVPLEALLAGTPVVVADDSGCGEVIQTVGGGLVSPLGDDRALATAMSQVLEAPEAWRVAAVEGAIRVRARYSGDVVAERLASVYESVVRQRGRARQQGANETATGVSVVLPVLNGEPWLREVVESVSADAGVRPFEILAVDDGSSDGSVELLDTLAASHPIRVLEGRRRGAAAAINVGVRAARFPIICQVDQDVVVQPGWMSTLLRVLEDLTVGAVQGHYVAPDGAGLFSRVMGLDVAVRYAAIPGTETDHVCTGNTVYRAEALHRIGLFDESLGYGYDNDVSYRLREAGYRLELCRDARAVHRWRDTLGGYWRQQFGFGYGRLELVAKHPHRVTGDRVSPASMMLHPPVMLMAVGLAGAAGVGYASGMPWTLAATASAALVAALAIERAVVGVRAAVRFAAPAGLLFPVVHLIRDLSWVAATVTWLGRRWRGRPASPGDSMRPRPATRVVTQANDDRRPTRALALIPAHNEAAALPSVIEDLSRHCPDLDVLVIDDGSTDATRTLLRTLGVRWLRLPERMGIGSAMRAGLTLAGRLGYDTAVRVDGDGQHAARDVARVLAPLYEGRADVATGSRFATGDRASGGAVRLVQRALGVCLSRLTGRPVTDPTSGFCAFGPRAISLLADHHPTGYPEPELRLFVSRNHLTAVEVPIEDRPRIAGRTTLTPGRLVVAAARITLALVVVPLRTRVRQPGSLS